MAQENAAPPAEPRVRRLSQRTKTSPIAGSVILATAIVVSFATPACAAHRAHQNAPQTQTVQPAPTTTTTTTTIQPSQSTGYLSQTVLPFTGLSKPGSVAVDSVGNVYVTDNGNQVLKLAAGTNTQTVLPFPLVSHDSVAVDSAGNVYVTNDDTNQVLKLTAGSTIPTVLPFPRFRSGGIAVDGQGGVYLSVLNGPVLKLAAGSSSPTELLSFTGGDWSPESIAVDTVGDVYVVEGGCGLQSHSRVLKLAAGTSTQTELPFNGLVCAGGLAVDSASNVYLADGPFDSGAHRVLKLAAGTNTETVLPFTGLSSSAYGVAVDSAGAVYVADRSNNRVLKLPVQ